MNAAAAVISSPPPLCFPPEPQDFLKVETLDIARFGKRDAIIVAALRYRAKRYGLTFLATYEEIQAWVKNLYHRSSIAAALRDLRKSGFLESTSDGRSLWITLLENPRIGPQKSKECTPHLNKERAREQAERTSETTLEAERTPVEKTFPRSPVRESGHQPVREQPPKPPIDNRTYQALKQAAVTDWKMQQEVADVCPREALRLALAVMPERVAHRLAINDPIEKTGAYLRRIIERSIGRELEPLYRPKPKSRSRDMKTIGQLLFSDDYSEWQRRHEIRQ